MATQPVMLLLPPPRKARRLLLPHRTAQKRRHHRHGPHKPFRLSLPPRLRLLKPQPLKQRPAPRSPRARCPPVHRLRLHRCRHRLRPPHRHQAPKRLRHRRQPHRPRQLPLKLRPPKPSSLSRRVRKQHLRKPPLHKRLPRKQVSRRKPQRLLPMLPQPVSRLLARARRHRAQPASNPLRPGHRPGKLPDGHQLRRNNPHRAVHRPRKQVRAPSVQPERARHHRSSVAVAQPPDNSATSQVGRDPAVPSGINPAAADRAVANLVQAALRPAASCFDP